MLYAAESGKAGEGVRLKLQTPLFVADALVGASGRLLQASYLCGVWLPHEFFRMLYVLLKPLIVMGLDAQAERDAAVSELQAIRLVERQLQQFQADMERDAAAQREALNKVSCQEKSNALIHFI